MNTYAYDAHLPCKNPNCKSQGVPHPNCRCYSNLAEGGEATHYCAQGLPHKPSCQYFAGGGDVQPLMMGDPGDAVSNSLYHSGAFQLLKGNLNGAYREDGMGNIHSYAKNVSHGSRAIKSAIEAVFGDGNLDHQDVSKEEREKLHKFLEEGILNQQLAPKPNMMAQGGLVKAEDKSVLSGTGPMENALPAHNMMIQSAKTRVNNYLNSLRPMKDLNKKPFDNETKDDAKKHNYEKAMNMAIRPSHIFNHIKDGSLTASDVQNFNSIYPEVGDHLRKKLTEKVVESQLDNKKPKYQTRQALSLFLGAPLDSTFSPASIQAAQMVFLGQKAQAPQPQQTGKNKKSTNSLSKMPQQFRTSEQSTEVRQQREK